MEETKEQMLARHSLQEATAADPTVASNLGRHMAALNVLLLGRRGRDASEAEPIIQSGFQLTPSERDMMMATACRMRADIVHLSFDVERATAAPLGIIVIHIKGEMVFCEPRCALWMPAGGQSAILVGLDESRPCHFVLRRDQPLVKVEGWPAPSIEAGQRRGGTALFKLAASAEMRKAHIGTAQIVVGFDGKGRWTNRSTRIAA